MEIPSDFSSVFVAIQTNPSNRIYFYPTRDPLRGRLAARTISDDAQTPVVLRCAIATLRINGLGLADDAAVRTLFRSRYIHVRDVKIYEVNGST